METKDIRKELKSKERSLADLHRYITTRTENTPNYILMLGSGCSVSSGIPTGQELIETWRKEVYIEFEENKDKIYNKDEAVEFLLSRCGSWYNSINEYSSLFEKKYDLKSQRRMFVEKQVDGAQPSIGYAYLCSLMERFYFNAIFTTNFDDLINESFFQFTELRPIVCAHDSSISSITLTSKRPKIIKLHGDYLFDDIKSTLRETESLEDNIKNKFIEFSKDHGVIFVGYSGCDRSIMDVMNYLLKQEDYIKNGIYWCLREDDHISEELRKLLWKDKVYYVIIDGFDELFAYLYGKIVGDKIPIDTGFVSSKSQETVKRMLENKFLCNSKSDIILKHLEELSKFSKKQSLQSILNEISSKDYIDAEHNELSDEELVKLFKVKEKMNSEIYHEVIKECNTYLNDFANINFKIEIYKHLITAYKSIGEQELVLSTYDKLIQTDQRNPVNLLNKSRQEKTFDNKLQLIELALQKDPYFYRVYYEKAEILSKKYRIQLFDALFDEIINLYDSGIEKYPSLVNPSYNAKFNFILSARIEKDEKTKLLNNLINTLEKQRADSSKVLRMKLELMAFENKKPDNNFLNAIKAAKYKYPERNEIDYDILMLESLAEIGDRLKIEEFILSVESSKKHKESIEFLKAKAIVYAQKLRNIDAAIGNLEKVLEIDEDITSVNLLLEYYIHNKDYEKYDEIMKKFRNKLDKLDLLLHEKEYLESVGDSKASYHKFCEYKNSSLFPEYYKDQLSYHLIKIGEYEEAKKVAKDYLDSVNFNKNAFVAIINYELSQILLDKKRVPNKKRLSDTYEACGSQAAKAAIQTILNDKDKAFHHIQNALNDDYTVVFSFKNWPVFDQIHSDPRWQEIVLNNNFQPPKMKLVGTGQC